MPTQQHVTQLLAEPWLIRQETVDAMLDIYMRHSKGDRLDPATVGERLGVNLDAEPSGYEVHDGVAVINVLGILGKRFDLRGKVRRAGLSHCA